MTESVKTEATVESLHRQGLPLANRSDLDPLIDAAGHARYVLLGEASHGTHDFYTWRSEITKRLILEKQCAFIAVEGDWPDCYRLNRYIKGRPNSGDSAEEVLRAFDRWPTWMWANRETEALIEWLRDHNASLPKDKQVGFYGLDVYSLWESMKAVVDYLETVDPKLAETARGAYRCFEPYSEDARAYARATIMVPTSCEDQAVRVLQALRDKAPVYQHDGPEDFYNAEQNALVAQGAERYYRAMIRGGPESWNVRDRHMVHTLERLMAHHGKEARCVVWAHNTHVGDARYTDMADAGMVNLGQLLRDQHGQRPTVYVVGFGTYQGRVMAGDAWGAEMEAMRMPPARRGSLEYLLHQAAMQSSPDHNGSHPNLLLMFNGCEDGGIAGFDNWLDHRAIGVVYQPHAERWGNYVPTLVARRYDAFLFMDRTREVDALHLQAAPDPDLPETYPSGR